MSAPYSNRSPGDRNDSPIADYVVVARRYRPQSFEELIGQTQVTQALTSAIATNRVGHAYLFTGARGVGKTSAARILAKALNCFSGPTTKLCNECDSCLSIAAGQDVDVLEIDGASNRGIDEIRELRSNVNVRPSRSRFKIYIIDEVHMLTTAAFNALLKTLEEPPEHVKFIFCTTDPEKIPITVLSRCQRFDFSGIRSDEIVDRLRQIAVLEDVDIEDAALQILARRAGGSMRDSQSLLEQLLAFGEGTLSVEDVHHMLGTACSSRLMTLVQCLVERDSGGALRELDEAIYAGVDTGPLLDQLLGYFRDMMIHAVGADPQLLMYGDEQAVGAARRELGLETILAALQILDQTAVRMRQSTHGRILLELAIVRISNLENLDNLSELILRLDGGVSKHETPVTAKNIKKKIARAVEPTDKDSSTAPRATIALSEATAVDVWKAAILQFTDLTADQALQFDSVAMTDPNRLVVSFQKRYDSCRIFCEQPGRRARLEQSLQEVSGRSIRLELRTLDVPQTEVAETSRPVRSRREQMRAAAEHPLVGRAMELFNAELMRVDEPREQVLRKNN